MKKKVTYISNVSHNTLNYTRETIDVDEATELLSNSSSTSFWHMERAFYRNYVVSVAIDTLCQLRKPCTGGTPSPC